MAGQKLSFFEKLAELLKVAPEKVVFDKLNAVLEKELEELTSDQERSIVTNVQRVIETEYNLPEGAMQNCFQQKASHLTEPKKMWVLISYTLIGDKQKVVKLIGNGLKRGHFYRYQNEFMDLNDAIQTDKEFKEKFNEIMNTYGSEHFL